MRRARVSISLANPGIFLIDLSPQTPIMKYIGSRTTSKKMKNNTRSSATNVPFIPVPRINIRIRNALGLRGSSQWSHE